jgi:hypothetical protein
VSDENLHVENSSSAVYFSRVRGVPWRPEQPGTWDVLYAAGLVLAMTQAGCTTTAAGFSSVRELVQCHGKVPAMYGRDDRPSSRIEMARRLHIPIPASTTNGLQEVAGLQSLHVLSTYAVFESSRSFEIDRYLTELGGVHICSQTKAIPNNHRITDLGEPATYS